DHASAGNRRRRDVRRHVAARRRAPAVARSWRRGDVLLRAECGHAGALPGDCCRIAPGVRRGRTPAAEVAVRSVMSRIESRTRVVAIALAALLAAGLPAAATAAGPTEISGRVVLPAGVSNEGFWVETSTWDASTGRWKYARMVAPEPDGSFTLATRSEEHTSELQ